MTKSLTVLTVAALAAGCLSAQADSPMAMHSKMASGKMVPMYLADKCHMYYTPAQAKMYHYTCPGSKGKMKMVKVTPAVAKTEMAKTSKELAPKKAM